MKEKMSKTLWSNVNHQISRAYHAGYGKSASERRYMRENEDKRTIAVKSSREVIKNDCKRFCDFVKERHPECRTIESSKEHIREWAEHLVQERGLRPETVHGYIDHLGVVYGVSGGDAEYGNLGRDAHIIKGREERTERDVMDRMNEKYERFVELSEMTGLRRSELQQIRADSFYQREDGYYYVDVVGKGGKEQAQRILHEHDAIVEKYLDMRSSEPLLSREECQNHINAHANRRDLAQMAYEGYKSMCETQEGRERLFSELKTYFDERYDLNHTGRTWEDNRDMQILSRDLESVYHCRGEQRDAFIEQGQEPHFDRLAMLAVSVFHLAHWRCDVTVQNYMK